MHTPRVTSSRTLLFIGFTALAAALFFSPLKELFLSSFDSDIYNYIVLIPLVSGYFMYTRREEVVSDARLAPAFGIPVIAVGTILYVVAASQAPRLDRYDYLFLTTFAALAFWTGGFVFFYGVRALKAASFPLMFLIFMVPMPAAVLDRVVRVLQVGSTESAYAVLRLTGVPVVREGFTFYLPGLSVQVAEECSGIHSGLSLFITAVIAAHLFLTKGSRKAALLLSVFPIAVFKNGLRIVSLSLIGAYVDRRILDSQLHRNGGIPFFLVALLMLGSVLWALRKSESGARNNEGPKDK